MIVAIVLLKVERKMVNEIGENLSRVDGVAEVYSVSGRYDLVAVLRLKDNDALSDVVTGHLLKIDGILHSETMLAFRTFSRHDLESMFSIGE
jgi:DNA-binding Lrp family transcriptional regulator